MSGGQLQRVMIAIAISCQPIILIADEPTTALDVTVQGTILELLKELCRSREMALIFITHDLAVVANIADSLAVMYQGKIVEYGTATDILLNPQQPYTKGLLACRPRLDETRSYLPTVTDFLENKLETREEKFPVKLKKNSSNSTFAYRNKSQSWFSEKKPHFLGKKIIFGRLMTLVFNFFLEKH